MGEEWRPPGTWHRWQAGVGVGFVLLGLLRWWTDTDEQWLGTIHVLFGLLQASVALYEPRRRRVRVGPAGLDVPGRWWRRATVPWSEVVDVRGNAGAWSEHLLLELADGRVVALPPGLAARTVAGWRERYAPGHRAS